MATKQQIECLGEHLPYALLMLRYTMRCLKQPQHFLDRNAYMESFAVHARTLIHFLTNDESNLNFKASDFVPDYQDEVGEISKKRDKLNAQVFHLGKNRPMTSEDKFTTKRAEDVFDWIEPRLSSFLAHLGPLKQYWRDDLAHPPLVPYQVPKNASGILLSMTTSLSSTIVSSSTKTP